MSFDGSTVESSFYGIFWVWKLVTSSRAAKTATGVNGAFVSLRGRVAQTDRALDF